MSPEEAKLPPMTTYVLGLLRRAPDAPETSDAEAEAIQDGHLAHIRRMREQGDLILSGPLLDEGDLRGIRIFRNRSIEDARALTRSDLVLQSRKLVLELHELYAAAGLRVISPDEQSP
jgi:uncharacterized protein